MTPEDTLPSLVQRPLIIGTAGHIDHGKSSLVEALTGTDPDRLAEEKRRGITIELGFAQLQLSNDITLGVVDVPGHEKFIRQMIAGASGVDIALLCIAADDGIMPQTREHLAVLHLLGVNTCVIALTKCDLVDEEWLSLVQEEIRNELSDGPFADAPLIPVSAHTGQGLSTLKNALLQCAHRVQFSEAKGPARLPIDRVFTIKGAGTVVTGTLWQGRIGVDDELEILPTNKVVRVRSVQVHGKQVKQSVAGMRTALNLVGVKTSEVSPGDFLVEPQTLQPSDRFDALFTYIPLLLKDASFSSGLRVRIAHGTREVTGRLLLMDGKANLARGETTYAQVRLDQPLPLSRTDRFIVRLLSPARVIGGGVVLNNHPRRRTTLHEADKLLLDALKRNDDEDLCCAVVDAASAPISARSIKRITNLSETRIAEILSKKTTGKGGLLYPAIHANNQTFYARRTVIQKHLITLENTLLSFHADNPHATGISRGALKARYPFHLEKGCFDALLNQARIERKALILKSEICHPTAGISAQQLEKKNAQLLFKILKKQGATPPNLLEIFEKAGLDASQGSKALGLLEQQGKAQRINKTLCFTQEILDTFWEATRTYLETHQTATAAELKEAMQTSRKYAIPLLEYFDQQKLTCRQGDVRILSESMRP